MSLTTCVALIWIVAVLSPQHPQDKAIRFPQGTHSVTLNAAELNGQFLIPVEINGQHLSFLLGSRAGETIVDNQVASRLHLKRLPDKSKLSGSKQMSVEVTEGATVVIANTKLRVQTFVISGLTSVSSTRDFRVDGIIGYSLLNSAVVVVDYPAKRITVIDPDSFNYRGKGESVPVSLSQGWASIGATLLVMDFYRHAQTTGSTLQ